MRLDVDSILIDLAGGWDEEARRAVADRVREYLTTQPRCRERLDRESLPPGSGPDYKDEQGGE